MRLGLVVGVCLAGTLAGSHVGARPVRASSPAAAQERRDGVTLETVLGKMGEYVAAYGERAALIVATENYTQRVEGEVRVLPRKMVAEFAVVKVPGAVGWIGFRDVVEVNGEKLTDRRERLLTLLSDPDGDVAEATRISNESARFNVGPISRNFNVPTTTLFFFHPANQSRFSFQAKGTKKIEGVETWEIAFKETRHPSLVMTRGGKDVPCEGTVWVSPADGTIVRTLVTFRGFADDRVLQGGVRPGANRSTWTEGGQSPAVPVASPAPASAPPAQAQPPAKSPGQGQGASSPAPSGQKGAGASAMVGSSERAEPLGRGPAPWQLFSDTSVNRKIESLARIEVTYHRHSSLDMWLPSRMSELYEGAIPRGSRPPFFGQATTTADYSDFKQFTTAAKVVAPK